MELVTSALTLILLIDLSLAARKLKMVHLLYRHGDRSPVGTFPTDPHQESAWPDGFGQLSQIGMRMEYNLGQFLRQRYATNSSLVNPAYMHKQVHIRSSNSDRCLMSAETQLAGLYPPAGYQVWNKKIAWQPVPVHTVPSDNDPMLRPWDCVCPRLTELLNQKEQSSVYQAVSNKYKGVFKFVTKNSGMNVTLRTLWHVSDALYCEQQHKMKLPKWVTDELMRNLTYLNNADMQIFRTGNAEFSRLSGGPLLAEIVNHMKLLLAGKAKDVPRLNIYSAHDTTVIPLLGALKVFNGISPPYAAAVQIEVYQVSSGKYTIDVLYRNDSNAMPYKLKLPGCADECPLTTFINLTKDRVSVDREKECRITTRKRPKLMQSPVTYFHDNLGLVIGLSLVLLLMLIIIVGLIVQCRKRSGDSGYSSHQIRRWNLQDTDEEESDSAILLKGT